MFDIENLLFLLPIAVISIIILIRNELNKIEIMGECEILRALQENEIMKRKSKLKFFSSVSFLYFCTLGALGIFSLFLKIPQDVVIMIYVTLVITAVLLLFFVFIRLKINGLNKLAKMKRIDELNVRKEIIEDLTRLEVVCTNIKSLELKKRICHELAEFISEKME